MICSNCQKVNQEDAHYCPYCGFAFLNENYSEHQYQDSRKDEYQYQQLNNQPPHTQNQYNHFNNQYQQDNHQNSYEQQKQNQQQHDNRSQPMVKNFFHYFQQVLKNPTQFSLNAGKDQFVNGYITLILTALFFGLAMATIFHNLFNPILFAAAYTPNYFSNVFSAFLANIIWLALTAALLFVVVKYIMKINITFHHIIARFGAFSNIMLISFAISFVLAMTGLPLIMIIVLVMSQIIHFVLVFVTIKSFKEQSNSTFDPIYATLIVSIVTIFISQLFAQNYINNVLYSLF